MAELVLNLAKENPAEIVIDKHYSPHGCSDSEANRALANALDELRIPVVIGQNAIELDNRDKDLVLTPKTDFGDGRQIRYGLLEVDSDPRRIPLGWRVFGAGTGTTPDNKSLWMPSLALVAAQEFNPEAVSSVESKGLKENHPYTTLINESEIPTYSAIDLVCAGRSMQHDYMGNCPEGRREPANTLRGRIVVIGNIGEDTFIGGMPGVMLQANYIESLLDDRYFTPLSPRLELIINLILAIGFAWFFFRAGSKKMIVVLPLYLLIPWIVAYLLITLSGYYVAVWFPFGGLLGLGARYWRASEELNT